MGILDAITGRAPDVDDLLTTGSDAEDNGYKRAEPAPYSQDRPLTAAAKRIDLSNPDDVREAADAPWRTWQLEAWEGYECADDQTEILTQDGWKTCDEASIGDLVLTLNHEDGSAGWEPILDLFTYDVEDESMLDIDMRHHSSLTTLNHRWPTLKTTYGDLGRRTGRVRAWETSGSLYAESRLITAAPVRDLPKEPKYDDDFVELVAWFWTEGSIRPDRANKSVIIHQSNSVNPGYVARIRNCLTGLFGPPRSDPHLGRTVAAPHWSEKIKANGKDMRLFKLSTVASQEVLEAAPDKVVSHEFLRSLTRSQLDLFLHVSLIADGVGADVVGRTNRIGQSDPKRLESYEFACILAGRTPHTTYDSSTPGADRWWLYDLSRTTAFPEKQHRQIKRYTGRVWCPRTPSGTWMARRRGTVYFTGNSVPEIHYGYELLAAVMSRLRLFPAVVLDPDSPPSSVAQIQKHRREQDSSENVADDILDQHEVPDDLTDEVMDFMTQLVTELGSGYGGISGLMRMFTLNISMPGECYLALIDKRWSIRSTSEIRVMQATEQPILTESRISNSATGQPWKYLPKSTPLIRIYRQHPRFSKEPVSSVMSVLESVQELRAIQQMIRGIARSRMNAGIVFIPDDLRVAGQSVDRDVEAAEDETEDLLDEMFDAFTAPITNETAGTAAVPMAVTGPRESGEAIKHITFERQSDQWLIKRADDALARILNGLNFPKEKVEGLSTVKYVNANVVDDDLFRIHVEPLAVMLCDAVTVSYMRYRVRRKFPDLSESTLARIVAWYDPSNIIIKTDPADSANEGYDRKLVSGAAWRRRHGFSETDAPSQSEVALRTVIDEIGKNLPPERQDFLLQQAFPALFGENAVVPGGSPLPARQPAQDDRFGPNDALTTSEQAGGSDDGPVEMTD